MLKYDVIDDATNWSLSPQGEVLGIRNSTSPRSTGMMIPLPIIQMVAGMNSDKDLKIRVEELEASIDMLVKSCCVTNDYSTKTKKPDYGIVRKVIDVRNKKYK